MNHQECPLCNNPASFIGVDFGRRKYFKCDVCSDFVISELAERKIGQAPSAWKAAITEKAKNPPAGKVLSISLPSAQTSDGAATEEVALEYENPPR